MTNIRNPPPMNLDVDQISPIWSVRHLRAFVAVAEELSYRKAARRLHVAQPALSRTIQQLEVELLGAKLLERSASGVQLTEIGRFMLKEARIMLGTVQRTLNSVQQMKLGRKGELFVGFNDFTIAEFLPPIIRRFRDSYPDIAVHLVDETSPRMLQRLLENRLDIGFLSGMVVPPELDSMVLREEKFVAILPPGHPLANKRRLAPQDLAHEPFVMGEAAGSTFLKAVESYCEQAGFTPQIVQTAVHSNGVVNFVAAGIGVSIYVDREWLRLHNDVVVRPLPDPPMKFLTLAVWRRVARPSLKNLIEVMREVLK